MTTEKQAMRALRGHIEGTSRIEPGKGLHPGAGTWGTSNHDALGYEVFYAGDPKAGRDAVLDFWSRQFTHGMWTAPNVKKGSDESGSRSHDHVWESAAGLGLLLADKHDDDDLRDLLIRWWRCWLNDCRLHQAPRRMGKPGGVRFHAVDRGGARDKGADQSETRARTAAYLDQGTKPPKGFMKSDALDLTGLWALWRLPDWLVHEVQLAVVEPAERNLPATSYPYRVARWEGGHLGWWEGDLKAMYCPAVWTFSDYLHGKVTYGTNPKWAELDLTHKDPPPRPPIPPGARVVEYPVAKVVA